MLFYFNAFHQLCRAFMFQRVFVNNTVMLCGGVVLLLIRYGVLVFTLGVNLLSTSLHHIITVCNFFIHPPVLAERNYSVGITNRTVCPVNQRMYW